MSRLAALALAAALALGLVGCDTSSIVPGGSGDVMPNPAASQTETTPSDGQDAAFQMHFIDVGQALSVLVECDGQFMLYDGGNVDDGSLVVSYLQSQGSSSCNMCSAPTPTRTMWAVLAAVMAKFPAGHAYSPVTEGSTKCFNDFVKYTQQQGLQLEVPSVGTVWPLGSATVTLLGPVTQYSETNNTSLVLRIDYGVTSFLLTGDMENTAETDLVNSGANLKADVLQVGHHGSSTSTSYLFLNAVLPEMGVISCGTGNKYGHPPRGDVKHPAGRKGGRLPHRPARHHHHRQRRPELHRGHRALCAGQPAEPHRPGSIQHGPAGLHRQREQQKVPSAQLRQPPGREEPDFVLEL